MALFYADLAEGQEFTTPARTITESDVVQFSGLTGDYNPIHTDAEFAAEYPLRAAHRAWLVRRLGLHRTDVPDRHLRG